MKILINISVISKSHRGMGVFTRQIVKELLLDNNEYLFVSGNNIDDEIYEIISLSRHKFIQFNSPLPIFEQIVIPLLLIKYKPDICWFPSNTFPLIRIYGIKYVATIHDLIFLNKGFKGLNLYQIIGKIYRKVNFLYGVEKLDVVTSVSKTSSNKIFSISNSKNLDRNNILYNSIDLARLGNSNILDKLNLRDKNFFYTISGVTPHKNLDFLIKSFLNFCNIDTSYILVVSGAFTSRFNGLHENILFTSFITDEEKSRLIKESEVFIFASLVEGFGIPLIEGLYFNNKVLVSDIDIFRELGKQYVSYFDPYDEDFLVKYCNKTVLSINHQEAQEYILDNFNSKKTTQKLVGIFNELK